MIDIERQALPGNFIPVRYQLCLEPDFERGRFAGSVQIELKILVSSGKIVLNSKYINITEASVRLKSELTHCESIIYNETEETVTFTFPCTLPKGKDAILDVKYDGCLNHNSEGLHQNKYTDKDGIEHHVAATAPEPTYAREILPCFDEPSIKSRFVVSAVVDNSFACFSNMPISSTEPRTDLKKLVFFEETPLMSTYLLAFMTGHLVQVQSTTSRVPLSIICRPDREADTKFALGLASKGLKFFEELFDFPYPLPKLDLAAVPEFAASGIECWGLVVFKEINVLLDQDSAFDRKRIVAETVLHELAHMWFGDLVTMRYWDGLWLKEGFAQFMAWVAMDKFFPEWKIWDRFVTNNMQTALDLDSLHSSHAVEQRMRGPREIKQMYDDISYEKGCCILRMVSSELGFEKFIKAVRLYIQRFQYQSTESEDLWAVFEELFQVPVVPKMKVWTTKPGFPMVQAAEVVTEDEQGKHRVASLHLSQSRFDSAGKPSSSDVYPLRISVRFETGPVETFDMTGETATIPVSSNNRWFKINANHDGFFVTSYTPLQLRNLISAAVAGDLTVCDCVGLSCDLRRLVIAGINESSDLLDLIFSIRAIDSYLVWETIIKHLRSFERAFKFQPPSCREGLFKISDDILGKKALEIGWDLASDDFTTANFKADVFLGAGLAGNKEVIKAARGMFAQRITGDDQAIPPSLRYEVFGIVAAHGGKAEVLALLDIWNTSKNDDEKYLAVECLGYTRQPDLIQWVLDHALTGEVGGEDLFIMLWVVGETPAGAIELWAWTKQNWATILDVVPSWLLPDTFKLLIQGLNTDEQIADVKDFFETKDMAAVDAVLSRKLEEMETNRCWVERDAEGVATWLESHGYMSRDDKP